jgi:hypothetical protein
MPEMPEDLQTAVQDQADARVQANVQGYTRYLKPEAMEALRASSPGIPPRVTRFEVDSYEASGDDHVVHVRFFKEDGESFQVKNTWRKEGDGWMIVHAERLWEEGEERPGLLSRMAGSVLRALSGLRRS